MKRTASADLGIYEPWPCERATAIWSVNKSIDCKKNKERGREWERGSERR